MELFYYIQVIIGFVIFANYQNVIMNQDIIALYAILIFVNTVLKRIINTLYIHLIIMEKIMKDINSQIIIMNYYFVDHPDLEII